MTKSDPRKMSRSAVSRCALGIQADALHHREDVPRISPRSWRSGCGGGSPRCAAGVGDSVPPGGRGPGCWGRGSYAIPSTDSIDWRTADLRQSRSVHNGDVRLVQRVALVAGGLDGEGRGVPGRRHPAGSSRTGAGLPRRPPGSPPASVSSRDSTRLWLSLSVSSACSNHRLHGRFAEREGRGAGVLPTPAPTAPAARWGPGRVP